MKYKKYIFVPIIVILCVVFYVILAKPGIETRTWVLTSAQRIEPFSVVAHKKGLELSDEAGELYAFSKEIELTCMAKDGKLTLTDKTNGKTYEGTYKVTSRGVFSPQHYSVTIDGKEGLANISSKFNRTLFISLDGYSLNFEAQ